MGDLLKIEISLKEVVVAEIIKFYIPTNFQKKVKKWVLPPEPGKIIRFPKQKSD